MKHGHWIPISKYFLKSLPHDREYTELEAAYSLQSDFDNKSKVTITGYCNLWRWSKCKVYRFLDRMNIKILYPESTSKKRNQNGLITIHKPELKQTNNRLITDLKQTNNGLIRLIDNSDLQKETDLKRTKDGLKTDLKQVTTIEPITLNPKSKKKNNKRKILLPDDYQLTEKHIRYATGKNITTGIEDIFEDFCIYHRKVGSKFVDWYAAWQNWIRNKIKWDKEKEPSIHSQILTKEAIDKLNE
jgi:hypothetical protein